jgi:hypothetical protein
MLAFPADLRWLILPFHAYYSVSIQMAEPSAQNQGVRPPGSQNAGD